MTKRVQYAVRGQDERAIKAIECLRLALSQQLAYLHVDDDIDQHAVMVWITGDEPPCAPFGSVPIFTCDSLAYPSRFFRVITPANREKLLGYIPLWAQSTEIQVAFNPKANLERKEKKTQKPCFNLACTDLQRRLGGFAPPRRKRPHYVSGRKARIGKPYFAET